MKITDITTTLVFADWRNWTFIRIFTDEGFVGLGEATIRAREHAVASAVEDMSRVLIGMDPRQIQSHWQMLYRDFHNRGGVILMSALSGIEIALWDILGQYMNVPIHALLGGDLRESAWAYTNGWFLDARDPERLGCLAQAAVQKGFTALKWNPFYGAMEGWMSPLARRQAVAQVRGVRQAVGEDVELLLEAHGIFTPVIALQMADDLSAYRPFWIEEPCPPEDIQAMAHIRENSPIPVATGERLYGKYEFANLVERRAADIVQPDVQHAGGIFETRLIAGMAEARYMSFAPHNSSSPVGTAASLQVDACTPNFLIQELPTDDVPWRDEIVDPSVEAIHNGKLTIPSAPGLGVRLNEKIAAQHPYQPADVSSVVITPDSERLARRLMNKTS